MNSKYRFKELRSLARDRGVKRWYHMDKDQLRLVLNVDPPPPKFSLTCVETLEVTMWENSCSISKAYKVNTGCVFYALKVGKPLKTSVGLFMVKKKIIFLSVYEEVFRRSSYKRQNSYNRLSLYYSLWL